ncbi:dipeptide epimerase [Polaribacter glomeratus]|uniref:Dipeptide epimerase n=1 Tax=Polaribacter glomeratus TaxID=102 RepID=A0A2S7WGN7_9FLAO|nr:dipeptide epimerase [Polaribacter glomeratus]PQJ76471.1 dipeptide epimerase [Polaribacter glomeratus]TXD64233.1 dipeptide epimerase [Polaribacter glomeratus]
MKIKLHSFNLELKHTFTISRESHNFQETLIVALISDGFQGFGEATSNPYYNSTTDKMIHIIKKNMAFIASLSAEKPAAFWQKLQPIFKDDLFALCALDMAFNDLYARKQNKKLYEVWGLKIDKNPMTDYTIGIDSVDKMVAKMKELPWPIYKIKLGTKDDIQIVTELRKHTNAIFRIDANCGWSVEEAIENSYKLKELGVEFLEQPLKADDFEGAKKLYKKSALPIIADESCIVETDVEKCVGLFHGVNVKLTKCGGLTPGKRMLENAKKLGLKTMVGCMTESAVGISAIAHLLPLLDYVDMDGSLLLKEDIATGITINNGVISYAETNGIGATLL